MKEFLYSSSFRNWLTFVGYTLFWLVVIALVARVLGWDFERAMLAVVFVKLMRLEIEKELTNG